MKRESKESRRRKLKSQQYSDKKDKEQKYRAIYDQQREIFEGGKTNV